MFNKKKKQPKKKKQEMIDIDLMDELDFYQKPEKKKGIDQKAVIAGVLVVVVFACVLFSPVFAVKEIKAEGASHFTTSELCELIGLSSDCESVLESRDKRCVHDIRCGVLPAIFNRAL